MAEISVSVSVIASNQEDVVRAVEAFSRAAAELALEAIQTSISIVPLDEDKGDHS